MNSHSSGNSRFQEKTSTVVSGSRDRFAERLQAFERYLRQSKIPSLTPLLPLLLQLKGKPYTLDNHFPFEPFFRTRLPRVTLLKTGRQVSKSTSLAAQGVIFANAIPYFATLYVTPLFEMVRRFSHQYVREFIERSPVKRLFVGQKTLNSVLQRSFLNGSTMFFSYALLDAERTRGIPADKNVIDEVQDMQFDLLPIIHETLSGSSWAVRQYAGTPKSLDNTIEHLWQESSQAEWVIRCQQAGCGHWNIPALAYDLYAMIGPARDDVSEQAPGVVCAKCRKPLNPRTGHWLHASPQKRWQFAGYHVPQIILPMHYANPEKWAILVGKMHGQGNTTPTTFLNEVCGESSDAGAKLLTVADLKRAACLPWPRKRPEALAQRSRYLHCLLAVDWGGGGGRLASSLDTEKRLRTSFTTVAVIGATVQGHLEVCYGERSVRTHEWEYEAQWVLQLLRDFQCEYLVHDYGGAGAGREVLIRQAGFPPQRLVPVKYHGAASKNLLVYHEPTADHPRHWYSLDKSRSLALTCLAIKFGHIRFFEYDFHSAEDPGLLHDFLALLEEKFSNRGGTDAYYISSHPSLPDDFAQAVNIGSCAMWHLLQQWPDFSVDLSRFNVPHHEGEFS